MGYMYEEDVVLGGFMFMRVCMYEIIPLLTDLHAAQARF